MAITNLPPLTDYIAGKTGQPAQMLENWVTNPNTGEPLQQHRATEAEKLELALQTAYEIHQSGVWANTPASERADLMDKVADILMTRLDEMAAIEAATTGVALSLTKMLVQIAPLTFKAAAEQARSGWQHSTLPGPHGEVEVLRLPWGPAALIGPWNAPGAICAHKTANALAAGCPVILKPSEWAPHACALIAEAITEAGLPAGVFQIVHGGAEVGAKLVGDRRIRAVSFTGGLSGGRAVAQACAHDFKPMQLELGGNNPMIVLDDANLDVASQGVVDGMVTLNGQWCRALGRLIVHEDVQSALLEQTLDRLAEVKLGDSENIQSQMGPLIHAGHLQTVQKAVSRLEGLGGMAHSSTPLPDLPGNFIAPTLITGNNPADTLDEIFGPVAAVHTFRTDEEALQLANQTPFGLAGYVFGQDEERAMRLGRQINSGGIKINGVSLVGLHPMAPRPAWGLSGYGEEGTAETFQFFCGTRVVGVAG